MKENRFAAALILGVLFFATECHAHALSPVHYPLGPLPFLLATEKAFLAILIPVVIGVETAALWYFFRQLRFLGNLWRASVLYVCSRAGETVGFYSMIVTAPLFGWVAPGWCPRSSEIIGSAVYCLAFGLVPKIVAAQFLYRSSMTAWWKTGLLMSALTVLSYLLAVVVSVAVVWSNR